VINLAFFAFLLATQSSVSASATSDCASLAKNGDIYSCLNDYAKMQLAKDSPADRLFTARLNRLLSKYNLSAEQVKTRSLSESFSLFVDQNSQLKSADQSKLCFDFEAQWQVTGQRGRLVQKIKSQIDEAARFLAEIHASSWGHQVSLLFPIKEISICSSALLKNRAVSFEQRSLHIGLGHVLASHQLVEAWNSGNPIRSTELKWYNAIPYIGGKLRLLSQVKHPEGILRDKMADNWMILNPTGGLRTTALYTLAEAIFKIKAGMDAVSGGQVDASRMYTLMADTVRGPGFTKADSDRLDALSRDPVALSGLYNLWQQKIHSPQNILTVIENAIGDQARRNQNLHLTLRKIKAGISVANDKNIVVRLEQLMQSSIPVSSFSESSASSDAVVEFTRSETTTNSDGSVTVSNTSFRTQGVNPQDLSINADEVDAGVAVNLIDNVVVSVQIPNISPLTYRRVCLHQALSEFIVVSLSPAPAP